LVTRGLTWKGLTLLFVPLVLLPACRAVRGGPTVGSASSEEAVAQFVAGVRAEDLQAISAVWGNAEAPTRDRVDRQELERRLLIVVCHLRHEEARIGVAARGAEGRTIHNVELTAGGRTVTVPFTTIRNTRSGRWFVEDVDLRPAREFCRSGSATPQSRRLSIR
jgi:hypothetical protein